MTSIPVPTDGKPALRAAPQVLMGGAILLFLVGSYTGMHLRVEGVVVWPYIVCGMAGFVLTFRSVHLMKVVEVRLLLGMMLLTAIGAALAPQPVLYAGERAKGLVYLCYSLWLSYVFFVVLRASPRARVARAAGIVVAIILAGAALEAYGSLDGVSDAFRRMVFEPRLLYENNARDMALFGRVRPKLFTEEPSYVGLACLLSGFVWFGLTTARWRGLGLLSLTMIGFFLIRSPVVLVLLPAGLLAEMMVPPHQGRPALERLRHRFRLMAWTALAAILLVVAGATLLATRLEMVRRGQDLSTLIRVVGPPFVAGQVVTEHTAWGVGVGGREVLDQAVTRIFARWGFRVEDATKIINATWLFVIYYGVVGGALFAWLFAVFLKTLQVEHRLLAAAAIAVMGQTMGAFVGLRFWLFVFLVLLVAWHRSGNEVLRAGSPLPAAG